MILSFADSDSEKVWLRQRLPRLAPDLQRRALRKLLILDAAVTLGDVAVPPGNRLEKLSGDRDGQHSIRINDQWRVCFHWTDAGPVDVEICDYH